MFKYETLTFPNEMKTADKNHSHNKFSSSLSNFFKSIMRGYQATTKCINLLGHLW